MLVQINGGLLLEMDAKSAKMLIDAGKAIEVNEEIKAEKKTRKKVNNE
jgi:hypothetical protein